MSSRTLFTVTAGLAVLATLACPSGGALAQDAQRLGEAADRRYEAAGLAACLEQSVEHATWGGLAEALGPRTLQEALRDGWLVRQEGASPREVVVLTLSPSTMTAWTFAVWFEETDRRNTAGRIRAAHRCELVAGPTERLRPAPGRSGLWRRTSTSYSESCRSRLVRLAVDGDRLRVVAASDRVVGPPGDCRLHAR